MKLSSILSLWKAAPAVLCAGLFAGCATVTETGRSQLDLVSADEEMKLGVTGFQQSKQKTPISRDALANAMVQRAGQRIAAVANLPNAQWEFVVFESPEANAWCLPGGKVGVYTGILPITKDEAGLATVIGHEVTHATAHHGA
jgi:metalloendopeptidase OMA1, mitochondrial